MDAVRPSTSDRIKAIAGTALLQAASGYALIFGLAPGLPARLGDELKLFAILPPPPPPPATKAIPRPTKARKPAGAAAPPNLMAKATEIAAPRPVVPPIVIPPVVAAPIAGPADDPSAGASDLPGPGSGSGGQGMGTGSGGAGNGGGGGGTPARWLRGRIRDSDYPRAESDAGIQGTLWTRYVVGADGRVTNCTIMQSSGSPELDETTCRLVMQRYRYKPARDAQGRRVTDIVEEDHSWVLDDPPR